MSAKISESFVELIGVNRRRHIKHIKNYIAEFQSVLDRIHGEITRLPDGGDIEINEIFNKIHKKYIMLRKACRDDDYLNVNYIPILILLEDMYNEIDECEEDDDPYDEEDKMAISNGWVELERKFG